MAAFDAWADFYDLIHDGLEGDVAFYTGCAARTEGRVLELGAGTGRIAIPIAETGRVVVGMDDSASMLRRLCWKWARRPHRAGALHVLRADIAGFSLRGHFGFIAIPYRTFMHLLTSRARAACLAAARDHLEEGGLIALDMWNPQRAVLDRLEGDPRSETLRLAGRYRVPGKGFVLKHYTAMACSRDLQLLSEIHVFRLFDRRRELLHEEVAPLTRVWQTASQMRTQFRASGLAVVSAYGDFRGGAWRPSSPEMVWVLRKA